MFGVLSIRAENISERLDERHIARQNRDPDTLDATNCNLLLAAGNARRIPGLQLF